MAVEHTMAEEEGLLTRSALHAAVAPATSSGADAAAAPTPKLVVRGGHVATPHPPLENKDGTLLVAYTPTRLICLTNPCGVCKIGWLGSFVLFVNTIIGPGILAIPYIYATAGFYPTTLGIAFASVVACYAVIATSEVVRRMPNNATFERELAFCDPIEYFVGPRCNRIAHWLFFAAMFCQTVATISPAAQTLDEIGGFCFGRAWALVVTGAHRWTFFTWNESQCDGVDTCEPFFTGSGGDDSISEGSLVFTAGYALLLVVTMPFCQAKLDSQMGLQVVSFVVLVVATLIFIGYGIAEAEGFPAEMPDADFMRLTQLPGTLIFNFMYTVFCTSWLSEKAPEVEPADIAKSSAVVSGIVYVAFGSLMAVVFGTAVTTDVATVLSATERPTYVRVASYAFGLGVLVSGIPVNIIITRDNLLAARLSRSQANALAMVLPWCVSWLVYESTAFGVLVAVSGLVIVAPLALVVPFFLYLAMQTAPPETAAKGLEWFAAALSQTETLAKAHPDADSKTERHTGGWRGFVAWLVLLMTVIVLTSFVAEVIHLWT